jgi:1-deoxy-D-xylulose-5-phosphate synthase
MVVMTPSDENLCRKMLSTAFAHDGPAAVRYPRGAGCGARVERSLDTLALGRGAVVRESHARSGGRIAILGFGPLLHTALIAAEALDATVVDMRFVKPIDRDLLDQMAATHDALVSVEENALAGGAGSACAEVLEALRQRTPLLRLGLPDHFIDHGDYARLLAKAGLDAQGMEAAIRARFPELLREPRLVKKAG